MYCRNQESRHVGARCTANTLLSVKEFDGAARGNPGPAGAGAALFDDSRDMQVAAANLELQYCSTRCGNCHRANVLSQN